MVLIKKLINQRHYSMIFFYAIRELEFEFYIIRVCAAFPSSLIGTSWLDYKQKYIIIEWGISYKQKYIIIEWGISYMQKYIIIEWGISYKQKYIIIEWGISYK